MNRHTKRAFPCVQMPRRQRGTMLIIALIVLVAMTLAGIATMRSVDTASLTAGNIALRQSSVNAADRGIQVGYEWLFANFGSTISDVPASGYFSSAPTDEPNWSDPVSWQNAFKLNSGTPDAAGNVVSFIIQRLCSVPNCAPGDKCLGKDNVCGSTPDPGTIDPEGQDHFRVAGRFTLPPAIHYRITARAVGPRNSVSVVQVMLRAI